MVSLREVKDIAGAYPAELRSLIETAPDVMTEDEFLAEFLRWRRKARQLDAQKERQRQDP